MNQYLAKSATLKDIAASCGCSISTVSLALRGDERVRPRTTARIRARAAALGYDPARHLAARRLASLRYGNEVRSGMIGLLFPQGTYAAPFYAAILQGLVDGLLPSGHNLTLGSFQQTGYDVDPTTSLQPLFNREELDGLVFYGSPAQFGPALSRIRATTPFNHRPAVSLFFGFPEMSTVLAAEADGAAAATRHLLDLGHRHFALLYVPGRPGEPPVCAERHAGVRRALTEAGLPPAEHLAEFTIPVEWVDPPRPTNGTSAEAEAALLRFLKANRQVTALLAQNDCAAIHVWRVLAQAGLRVPADYSLVGFDDTEPIPDDQGNNMLTTVHMPLHEAGRAAAELISQRISGEAPDDETRTLPVRLVVRGTTAGRNAS